METDGSRFALMDTNPSRQQRKVLVDNILRVYDHGTTRQYTEGMTWYNTAHDLAGMVGFGDYSKGAGVIAALSANTGWSRNRELAEMVANGKGDQVKHFGTVLSKVEKIMGGAPPASVLGKGLKTQSFYLNIMDPTLVGPVTVDRHAHDIARGVEWGNSNRGLTTLARYNVIADAYRDAAALRDIKPHEMQAVTWVIWRDRIAGTSTRGKHL